MLQVITHVFSAALSMVDWWSFAKQQSDITPAW